uniref:non-specific serine/threonine protein kinase n=1 Tax=Panagrellus redivivus TaxID=6233 RepID=A0A7E4VVE2_PANRE
MSYRPRPINRKIDLRAISALETTNNNVVKMSSNSSIADSDLDFDVDVTPCASELLPSKNNLIRGAKYSYSVGRKIMPGRYGAVYEVLRSNDGKPFAAKLEICDTGFSGLNYDYKVLKAAEKKGCAEHFATLIDRGKIEGHFKFLVMPMLGQNLWQLRHNFEGNRFGAPTALRLALETLAGIERLHGLGYIHRDIKPSNFLINPSNNNIVLIDFGICRGYRNANGEPKPPREDCTFRGTTRYAALAAHENEEQSPKDDIESWFYLVVEFIVGNLPWAAFRKAERDTVRRLKKYARTTDGFAELCKHCPRNEFRRILTYIDSLGYYAHPDYTYLRSVIQLAMKNNGIKGDEPYDWQQDDTDEGIDTDKIGKVNGKQTMAITNSLNALLLKG